MLVTTKSGGVALISDTAPIVAALEADAIQDTVTDAAPAAVLPPPSLLLPPLPVLSFQNWVCPPPGPVSV